MRQLSALNSGECSASKQNAGTKGAEGALFRRQSHSGRFTPTLLAGLDRFTPTLLAGILAKGRLD